MLTFSIGEYNRGGRGRGWRYCCSVIEKQTFNGKCDRFLFYLSFFNNIIRGDVILRYLKNVRANQILFQFNKIGYGKAM